MGERNKHCQFCWAYYQNTKCIAPAESREMLCQRAIKQLRKTDAKEPVKKQPNSEGEAVNLKKYLQYIQKRIAFLKALCGEIVSNEYKYYFALQEAIKQWGKTHVLFYACIYGKIGTKQAAAICGVSQRTFYRIMSKQRKSLIAFIEAQERILDEKYPFIAFGLEV